MRHGRRDSNHAPIRKGLRDVCGDKNVIDTADLGNDFPDLVAGWKGRTYLLEVKAPDGEESGGQSKARTSWRGGPWVVVRSLAEALEVIGVTNGAQK